MFRTNRLVPKAEIGGLDLETRVALEAQITDERVAKIGLDRFERRTTTLEEYAAPIPWRRHVLDFLGPFEDRVLLDVACGYSMTPILFALAGATVYAIDVAPRTIATVAMLAARRGVADRVKTFLGPAESLPFADGTFDLTYGGAALHHLQLARAGPELARVMKPGGRGAFQDPLGHNRILEFVRDHASYRGKPEVKGTDKPFLLSDVHAFGRHFSSYSYRAFELISMAVRPLRWDARFRIRRMLDLADDVLFHIVPFLERYARMVVTCVTR